MVKPQRESKEFLLQAGGIMPTEHPNVVLSRQHFDLMADQYDELFITHMHDYDITHEMVLTMLPFPRESALRVLELGTGTGNLTQKLLDRFPQSTVVGYMYPPKCSPAPAP